MPWQEISPSPSLSLSLSPSLLALSFPPSSTRAFLFKLALCYFYSSRYTSGSARWTFRSRSFTCKFLRRDVKYERGTKVAHRTTRHGATAFARAVPVVYAENANSIPQPDATTFRLATFPARSPTFTSSLYPFVVVSSATIFAIRNILLRYFSQGG